MYQPSTKTPKKVFQKGGFCLLKRGFLPSKKGVFTRQKYGFCNAKTPFLKKQIGVLEKLKPLSH